MTLSYYSNLIRQCSTQDEAENIIDEAGYDRDINPFQITILRTVQQCLPIVAAPKPAKTVALAPLLIYIVQGSQHFTRKNRAYVESAGLLQHIISELNMTDDELEAYLEEIDPDKELIS